MMILKVLIEAFKYFIIRLRVIVLFISAFVLYIFMFKGGDRVGKRIMKTKLGKWINKRFER